MCLSAETKQAEEKGKPDHPIEPGDSKQGVRKTLIEPLKAQVVE